MFTFFQIKPTIYIDIWYLIYDLNIFQLLNVHGTSIIYLSFENPFPISPMHTIKSQSQQSKSSTQHKPSVKLQNFSNCKKKKKNTKQLRKDYRKAKVAYFQHVRSIHIALTRKRVTTYKRFIMSHPLKIIFGSQAVN